MEMDDRVKPFGEISDEFVSTAETKNGPSEGPMPYPRLEIDLEEFLDDLDDVDLTESQKLELLEALWMIMVRFVDVAFGSSCYEVVLEQFNISPSKSGSETQKITKKKEVQNEN